LPVCHHIVIVEAKNAVAFDREKRITACIPHHLLFFKMLSTIKFNDQICCMTDKICDVGANWSLPAEARIVQSMSAQRSPNEFLCIG
jgi:hypothetical protein